MINIYENLIEYSGVSEYIPKDISCYKEFNLESVINLSFDRPKMKEIIKTSIKPKINSTRIINTPTGKSLEGQELTGKKYIIEGQVNIRIDYLSETEDNKVHCTRYKQNFSSGIILHRNIVNNSILIPSIFIEQINAELLSNEQALVITTLLSTVEV
ncbi:SPOCS domain-containing protein [Clostridium taeniosporum]|uniref:DUF3794 domain-containing protein n=1 Tax=Clostridium taeniosporum TaxID=394958 RepID=A0A1D7XL29_9CLOT|nr:SPOCS domain-containing protein [Clostridium taeniosporum]AOR24031.1 DUF3794 domain-containing protein [Clostridium taeniosporum]